MKTQTKTKNTAKRKVAKRSKSIALTHTKHPVLRHFRLVGYKHTGKIIHHRHTSHLALVGILLIVGFFLCLNESMTQAQQITSSGSVAVSAIVPGSVPTIGATITLPIDGAKLVDQNTIEVSGTCAPGTFVVVKDNDSLVGSTICTNAGIFVLQIQLQLGTNILSALNYDNLNQPGPDTPLTTIYVTKTGDTAIITPSELKPTLPDNPSVIPGVGSNDSSCDNYNTGDLPIGGDPHIAVVCVSRFFGPKLQQVVGFIAWGGTPPYAVNIKWGNDSADTLISLPTPGYKTQTFSYAVAGSYKIDFKMTDANNKTAIVQTAVQVSGEVKTPIAALTDDILNTSWFKTPVPFYLLAVAVTLGFWGGDIFDRKFGVSKYRRKTHRTT